MRPGSAVRGPLSGGEEAVFSVSPSASSLQFLSGNDTPTPLPPDPGQRTADSTHFALHWGFSPDSPRLRAALTHTSAAGTVAESNERLEFLGDALLSAFVAKYLLENLPITTGEDSLSRARIAVIRKETLAEAARKMGVADLLSVGQGERKERRQTHDSLLADAYEALVAAIFLDRGQDAMEIFLKATLAEPLAAVVAQPPAPDAKTELQMQLQAAGRGLPVYRTVSATGVGHDHHFIVEAVDGVGTVLGRGEGPNKRTAQMEAARNALTLTDLGG